MILSLTALVLGFLLDLLLGDPHWLPHPIRLIGWIIAKLEGLTRRLFPRTPKGEFAAGVLMCLLVLTVSAGVPLGILALCSLAGDWLVLIAETIMAYQILAAKSLKVESMKVYSQLKQGDLPAARKAVSMIVGRDTQNLTQEQVTKAAVETVAENTSDGEIAPLLFLAIGGAPLGFFYKAVNTMDSMVGYQNERYQYFGCFAAKLDDVMNYLPARLSALLMIASAWLCRFDAKGAVRIWRRDRRRHASPNSAQTEAVCAGALGLQLAGDAYYFGELHHKPTIGDAVREAEPEDIPRANRLLMASAWLGLMVFGLLKAAAIAALWLV